MVLLNVHEEEEVKANLKRLGRCQNVAVRHVRGNPLHREDLKKVPGLINTLCPTSKPSQSLRATSFVREHMRLYGTV